MLFDAVRRFKNWFAARALTPRTRGVYLRQCGAEVGDDCFIGPTDLEKQIPPALLKIGNHVAIAADVTLGGGRRAAGNGGVLPPPSLGPIVIHDNCFIGLRSVIYGNVRIGPNSVVAAGSVVTSDVPPNTLVLGAPARPFGSLDRYRDKCLRRWAQQRPPNVQIEPGETWWSSRHLAANRELLRVHLLALFRDQLS